MKKATLTLTLFLIILLSMAGCSKDCNNGSSGAKTYVLVHGSWQAPYVWDSVKAQLEAKGQNVILVELPAHGNDYTSPAAVSMTVYRDKVIQAMSSIKGKVILVGHSMGGVVVSEVAEKIPSQIDKLVYIGAFVPANGQSLLYLSSLDAQSHLGPSIIPSVDHLTLDIIHDSIVPVFCSDAPPFQQQRMLDNFRPEPAIPFGDTVTLTALHFGRVDKYYIHTLQDNAIGIDLQNQMVAAAHITKVYSLNTSHSPFLSQPAEVTNLLLQIGK